MSRFSFFMSIIAFHKTLNRYRFSYSHMIASGKMKFHSFCYTVSAQQNWHMKLSLKFRLKLSSISAATQLCRESRLYSNVLQGIISLSLNSVAVQINLSLNCPNLGLSLSFSQPELYLLKNQIFNESRVTKILFITLFRLASVSGFQGFTGKSHIL